MVTASSHREAAFSAAEFLMDYLKTRAPFWKQVEHAGGKDWVEAKTTDDALADRWTKPPRRARRRSERWRRSSMTKSHCPLCLPRWR